MSNSGNKIVKIWTSSQYTQGRRNLEEFIKYAREELTLYANQGWEAKKWKPNRGQTIVFGFQEEGNRYSEVNVFNQPYLDFVKAFVRQQMTIKEITTAHVWITIFRYLYKALEGQAPDNTPCILNLTGQTLKYTELLIRRSVSNETRRYQLGGKLVKLVNWLLEQKIVVTLPNYKNPFPKMQLKAEQIGEEADRFREERCPTMHEMLCLAECFARAQSTADKYYTAALVLLCFAPGRINELGGLTINSLQQGDDGGWYVVWYGSKGFPDHRRGVPPLMLETVRKAFRRLIEISKPAREAAKWAYTNPNKFYRHPDCITPKSHGEAEPLTVKEFVYAMNVVSALHHTNKEKINTPSKWINALLDEGEITYRRLNDLVHQKYRDKNWPNNPKSNRPVWENLLLYRELELKPKSSTKLFSWVMPSISTFIEQLSKKPKNTSTLWERFEMTQEDGSPIALTTHQLRVWLNTHAKLGGMDDWKIAQWSGRADLRQNAAYDLRRLEHKNRLGKELLVTSYDEIPSAVTLKKINLPVPLNTIGVDREGVADFTGIGFCTHDFAQTPCLKAGECITCKDHVCLTGLPETLHELERMEKLIAEEFDKATQAAGNSVFGADRWVTHLGWKLAHIRTLITHLKDETYPEGTIIKIPVEHDPSPTTRALSQKGLTTELIDKQNHDEDSLPTKSLNISKILGFT